MTEAQIEKAARALCRLRGRDPDQLVPIGAGAFGLPAHNYQWAVAAAEVRLVLGQDQVQQAIAEAMKDER